MLTTYYSLGPESRMNLETIPSDGAEKGKLRGDEGEQKHLGAGGEGESVGEVESTRRGNTGLAFDSAERERTIRDRKLLRKVDLHLIPPGNGAVLLQLLG